MLFFSITDHKRRVQQWSYKQNFLLLNYSAHLFLDVHCSSKVKKKLFCVHTMIRFFFFFFSFSSFSISTRCSSLPSIGPHTLHFFPLQASSPPLAVNPSPCLAPTMPNDLCYLIFLLLCLSIFLLLKHQDPWSPVLGFNFVDGWWMGFVDGW